MPPYSPNLNIIERLWRILKKKVVYNKFYQKFDDFRIAVINFFENEIWRDKEFENILTDNFQIIKPNFSGSYLVWVYEWLDFQFFYWRVNKVQKSWCKFQFRSFHLVSPSYCWPIKLLPGFLLSSDDCTPMHYKVNFLNLFLQPFV